MRSLSSCRDRGPQLRNLALPQFQGSALKLVVPLQDEYTPGEQPCPCWSQTQGQGGLSSASSGTRPCVRRAVGLDCRSGLGQAVPGIGNASGCTDRTELGALT